MYADNCRCFSVSFPCSCAYTCVVPVYTYDATTQAQAQAQAQENGNRSILLCLCLCLRRCVVRVNRDDASINTSTTTRCLCLRCTGLHVDSCASACGIAYACVVRVNQALRLPHVLHVSPNITLRSLPPKKDS